MIGSFHAYNQLYHYLSFLAIKKHPGTRLESPIPVPLCAAAEALIRSVPNSIHLASFWNVLSSAPEMSPLSNSKIGRGSVPNVLWGNIVVHDTIQIVTLADSCAHENELFKILWTTNYGYYSIHALETPRVAFLKVVIKKNSHGVGRPNLPSVKGEVLGLSVRLVLDLVIGSLSLASGHVGANKR